MKWRDRLFTLAERYRAGELTETECRDQIDAFVDAIAAHPAPTRPAPARPTSSRTA